VDEEAEFRKPDQVYDDESRWFDRRKHPLGRRASDLYRFQIAPHNWGELYSILVVLVFFIGVIGWFLKLENRVEQMQNTIIELKIQVGRGILPVAEERLKALDEKVGSLQQTLRESRQHP
jgi:hypothetical protein